jgi:colanic acid biosynthesis protein WcaH
MIEEELYKKIVDAVPLLTVDVIVKHDNKYVLVKRDNDPLKGFWWVCGGRVLKGESIWEAAMRKVKEDIDCNVDSLELIGIYEDSYAESAFGVPTATTSIVFTATIDNYSGQLFEKLPNRFIHKLYKL